MKTPFTLAITAAIILSITAAVYPQNNAFVFNGTDSRVYIEDGAPVLPAAKESSFQYFNKVNSTNNTITVQAWVYLLGESPGAKMPIIYRTVSGGATTFSMYIQNRKAYFSVGNSLPLSTPDIPAFSWIQLTGIYDGTTVKFYYGKNLVSSQPFTLSNPYTSGTGLYIGKSSEGTFKGLIDEVRLWKFAMTDNNINGSGGNGNPAEPYPSSIAPYIAGQWSFTAITNNLYLADQTDSLNHLRVENITEIYPSKNLPFLIVNSVGDETDSLTTQTTLRAAIEQSNAMTGKQIIYFYIPGTAPFNIQPGTLLPPLTDPVIIDARFQSGYSGTPLVKVVGNTSLADGLSFSGGGSSVYRS